MWAMMQKLRIRSRDTSGNPSDAFGLRRLGCLAGYLIERLPEDGFVPHTVHVERKNVPAMGRAHAWAVYGAGPDALVGDPAQDFAGTKAEARARGRWEYATE